MSAADLYWGHKSNLPQCASHPDNYLILWSPQTQNTSKMTQQSIKISYYIGCWLYHSIHRWKNFLFMKPKVLYVMFLAFLHLSLVFWMWRSSELLNYTFSKLCFSSKPSTLQGYYVGKKHKNLFYSGGFDATVESEDGVRRKKTQDVAPCSSAADLIPISCHCSKINFWKSDYTTKWPGKILCRVAFCSGFAWWIKTTGIEKLRHTANLWKQNVQENVMRL